MMRLKPKYLINLAFDYLLYMYQTKLEKIFALIRLLSGNRRYTRAEIIRETGIPRTTLHNYINELKDYGIYIVQQDRYYIYSRDHSSTHMSFNMPVNIETYLNTIKNKELKSFYPDMSEVLLGFYNVMSESKASAIPSDLKSNVQEDFIEFLKISQ